MNEQINIDMNSAKDLSSKSGIGEASARFCYAAAGLPNDVVTGFLELLETYSDGCKHPAQAESEPQPNC